MQRGDWLEAKGLLPGKTAWHARNPDASATTIVDDATQEWIRALAARCTLTYAKLEAYVREKIGRYYNFKVPARWAATFAANPIQSLPLRRLPRTGGNISRKRGAFK